MAKAPILNPLVFFLNREYGGGLVKTDTFFKERLAIAKSLYRTDLVAHYGCVNAIEFSDEGELLVSGGDDRRILLWQVSKAMYDSSNRQKPPPITMKSEHSSNIFCVAFDSKNRRIFSGGNDDQVIIHDVFSGNALKTLEHRKPVYGLSVQPQNDNILATAGEDGRVLLYDLRESKSQEAQELAKQKAGFHSVMFNPVKPQLLVTSNADEGTALWDCRKPKSELIHYDSVLGKTPGISACFDSNGKRVLALRRRLPPVLYNLESQQSICQFYHPQYYNNCTMKTCSFAGDNDEYIMSGSDDFNLYMWKVPENDDEWGMSHMVLKGHRSIVNQVRYNKHTHLIASSGVEKMIKLWSTLPIGTWKGSLLSECLEPARIVYSSQEYMEMVGNGEDRISHDYSDQCTDEDSKMMAFFDNLVQREIEGWDSSEEIHPTDSDTDSDFDYLTLSSRIFKTRNKGAEVLRKHTYNRIGQLISQKRHSLAKMAYNKARSSVQKMLESQKLKNDDALKQKAKAKNNVVYRRSLRLANHVETVKNKSKGSNGIKPFRYRTRQYLREATLNANLNILLDAPSTSTGITNATSSTYRVIDEDSDEEALNLTVKSSLNNEHDNEYHSSTDEDIPESSPPSLGSSSGEVVSSEITPDLLTNEELIDANNSSSQGYIVTVLDTSYSNEASSSRDTTSRRKNLKRPHAISRSVELNKDDSEDEESLSGNQANNGQRQSVNDHHSTTTTSELELDLRTPPVKRRTMSSSSDSGISTGQSSAISSASKNRKNSDVKDKLYFTVRKLRKLSNEKEVSNPATSQNEENSDDEVQRKQERFKKRAWKARVYLRNRLSTNNDSDSN